MQNIITTNPQLVEFVTAIKNEKILAVDTEFLRVNSYYPQLCLIQIASQNYAVCIDTLCGLDLDILFDKLYHQNTTLIFHSCRQDLETLYFYNKKLPKNIIDTQIIASFLGYPNQVSYANLVLDTLGVSLEKKYTRFDWSIRPLPNEATQYALDDVIYLLQLYYKFKNYEYLQWTIIDTQTLLDKNLYEIDPSNAYKKVKGIGNIGTKYQTLATNLSAYREQVAITKNKPRKWIFSDKTLFDYSMDKVKIPNNILINLPNYPNKIKKNKPPTQIEKKLTKNLQKLIIQKSLKYNLPSEIIANNKQILQFIRGKNTALTKNWRKKIMSEIKLVGAGDVPECINVVIEIPANSSPVKYELDKETNALFVDRFMSAPMFYPANYGFVPQTLADDGDPADVLVITPHPLVHNCVIKARPVGVLKMTDDGGVDAKILAVPFGKLSTEYDHIQDIDDVSALLKEQIEHFFTHYKELEKGKWVKIDGWDNAVKAKEILVESQKAYK